MLKLKINDKDIEVDEGLTVLQACEQAGIEIPRFCYHEKLSIAGNCRMCLVEMEKSPKPIASCAMPASEGMNIKTNTALVESAIQKSELGINPQTEGQIIRLRIPDLTEERRKDLIKVLKNMGEKGKISIRNVRREANEDLKKKLKDKMISEDDNKNFEKSIQKLTDQNVDNIEKILTEKEKEIIQI